mgnify:CR=1 FL=1
MTRGKGWRRRERHYLLLNPIVKSLVAMALPYPDLKLLTVDRIWDHAPHNAFTDLIRFKGHWYCAFREGESHVSDDGCLRVIRSADGKEWESVGHMEWDGGDVRDAKLSVTKEGLLMMNGAVRFLEVVNGIKHQSITWLSSDGLNWEGPFAEETGRGTWRWSVTWNSEAGYSFGYSGKDAAGCLYRTEDGKYWSVVENGVFPDEDGRSNESSIHFTEGEKALVLLRRHGKAARGEADAPYRDWTWQFLDQSLGGPKLVEIAGKHLFTVVRLHQPARRTACWIDREAGRIREVLTLPSGGDSSYAGIVEASGVLYVSYYSSHEEKTAIYFATLGIGG